MGLQEINLTPYVNHQFKNESEQIKQYLVNYVTIILMFDK